MIASNEAWNSELRLNVLGQIIQLFDYIVVTYVIVYVCSKSFIVHLHVSTTVPVCTWQDWVFLFIVVFAM